MTAPPPNLERLFAEPVEGRRRRRRHPRRRYALVGVGSLLVVSAVAAILVGLRYLPALDEARTLRSDLESMASRAQAAGLDIDRPTIRGLARDIQAARGRVDHLADLLASDPMIGLARGLQPTATQVHGADTVVAAAHDVFDAADAALAMGTRYVEIKEARLSDPAGTSAMAELVELMATSRDHALAAQAAILRARQRLASVPDRLAAPVESARDAMISRLAKYGPVLDSYVTLSARLPAMLGWDGPRRYLVLTQNPAELRPTGGYIGSYGIVTFDRGHVSDRSFHDVFELDQPWDYPYIKPPAELTNYLLGAKQSWALADANWSPDFPTSAQAAVRLYANESGDTKVDGVFGITTYTIDELLKVIGPINVPDWDTTIASGETTLKTLQLTRIAKPGETRKAFLSAFADELFDRLLGLPPKQWADLLDEAETIQSQRMLLAWFKDSNDQALATDTGFGGALLQAEGDYVYAVDSNVAPSSKLNAITTRSLHLDVALDSVGNAVNTLDVTWDNGVDTPAGRPYRELPGNTKLRNLGVYFRLLAPERSRIETVSGGRLVEITAPAVVGEESGRAVIGTYLQAPPGRTTLRYVWTSPYAAVPDQAGSHYRLTIQKQPGLLPGPLTVTIHVPAGYEIRSASDGLSVSGDVATLVTKFASDIRMAVNYNPVVKGAP
jgi:uncharacterized protein DUF4012